MHIVCVKISVGGRGGGRKKEQLESLFFFFLKCIKVCFVFNKEEKKKKTYCH